MPINPTRSEEATVTPPEEYSRTARRIVAGPSIQVRPACRNNTAQTHFRLRFPYNYRHRGGPPRFPSCNSSRNTPVPTSEACRPNGRRGSDSYSRIPKYPCFRFLSSVLDHRYALFPGVLFPYSRTQGRVYWLQKRREKRQAHHAGFATDKHGPVFRLNYYRKTGPLE